jgi:hypothetical protein
MNSDAADVLTMIVALVAVTSACSAQTAGGSAQPTAGAQ